MLFGIGDAMNKCRAVPRNSSPSKYSAETARAEISRVTRGTRIVTRSYLSVDIQASAVRANRPQHIRHKAGRPQRGCTGCPPEHRYRFYSILDRVNWKQVASVRYYGDSSPENIEK